MKVKQSVWNNECGFTLLEAIMTMVISSLILSFIPLMYLSYAAVERSISTEKDYEWNIFLIQFRRELYSAEDWTVGSDERILIEKTTYPFHMNVTGGSSEGRFVIRGTRLYCKM